MNKLRRIAIPGFHYILYYHAASNSKYVPYNIFDKAVGQLQAQPRPLHSVVAGNESYKQSSADFKPFGEAGRQCLRFERSASQAYTTAVLCAKACYKTNHSK